MSPSGFGNAIFCLLKSHHSFGFCIDGDDDGAGDGDGDGDGYGAGCGDDGGGGVGGGFWPFLTTFGMWVTVSAANRGKLLQVCK